MSGNRWGGIVPEIRLADGGRWIEGYAAVYYRSDDPGTEYRMGRIRERIAPGAFDRALGSGDDVRALYNHDPNFVLGRTKSGTLELETNRRGLKYRIKFDPDDSDHRRVRTKLEKGDVTGSSFAFTVDGEDWTSDDDGEIRMVTDVTLYDVGPVTFPAYQSASSGFRAEDLQEVRDALQKLRHPDPLDVRVAWLERHMVRLLTERTKQAK